MMMSIDSELIRIPRSGEGMNCSVASFGSSFFPTSRREALKEDFDHDPAYARLLDLLIEVNSEIPPLLISYKGSERFEKFLELVPGDRERQRYWAKALRAYVAEIYQANPARFKSIDYPKIKIITKQSEYGYPVSLIEEIASSNGAMLQASNFINIELLNPLEDYFVERVNQDKKTKIEIDELETNSHIANLFKGVFEEIYQAHKAKFNDKTTRDDIHNILEETGFQQIINYWNEKGFDKYLKDYVKKNGELGDRELALLGEALQLNVNIYMVPNNTYRILPEEVIKPVVPGATSKAEKDKRSAANIVCYKAFEIKDKKRELVEVIHGPGHYDLLLQKEEAEKFFLEIFPHKRLAGVSGSKDIASTDAAGRSSAAAIASKAVPEPVVPPAPVAVPGKAAPVAIAGKTEPDEADKGVQDELNNLINQYFDKLDELRGKLEDEDIGRIFKYYFEGAVNAYKTIQDNKDNKSLQCSFFQSYKNKMLEEIKEVSDKKEWPTPVLKYNG